MLCALSGEAPQEPVASKKSGYVFEKRLIEGYIAENGKDPMTGEELGLLDLVTLQTPRAVKPRPPTLTSIPALLATFQNEWDAVALETHELKQQLQQLRQELSHALYNVDASQRVIAWLTKERDEARDAIASVSATDRRAPVPAPAPASSVNGASSDAMSSDAMQVDSDAAQLPAEIIAKIDETKQKLSTTRRKRPVPDDWTTAEQIQNFRSMGKSVPTVPAGSNAFDIGSRGDFALVGGLDGSGAVFSVRKQETMRAFDASEGAVLDVACIDYDGTEDSKFSAAIATSTGEIKLFHMDQEVHSFGAHAGPATAVALHPCKEVLVSVGQDKSVVVYDLVSLKVVGQVFTSTALTSCQFHPDGYLFGVGGASGELLVFDIKTLKAAATFNNPGPVQALAFSENGSWLAIAIQGSSDVIILDLRKMATIEKLSFAGQIDTIEFDYSGQFLAAGGPSCVEVKYYDRASKSWSTPLTKAAGIVAVKWGPKAKGLAVVQKDGSINMVKESK